MLPFHRRVGKTCFCLPPSIGLAILRLPALAGIWLVALAGSATGQDDSPCGPSSRNGPLARLIPQEYHGADFRPACRMHDACYNCPGADKEACDRQFLDHLICACQNSAHPRRCEAWARRMYLATRVAGKRSFLRGQQ